jgi:hypothetical protein
VSSYTVISAAKLRNNERNTKEKLVFLAASHFFVVPLPEITTIIISNIKERKANMVKHIILWTLNPELTEEEKQTVKAGIKAGLEGLVGKVPGLLDVKVHVDGRLASSNADVMLDSTLESEEALKGYAVHPEHVAVANGKVRPYTVQRSCLDFEI